MKTTKIYTLTDPITGVVRYVGKTNNPKERFKNHLNRLRDVNTHKRNWINKLRRQGLKPIFNIIEEVSIEEWKEKEKFYIKKFNEEGCNLVNICGGGEGLTFGNSTSFKGENFIKIVAVERDGTYFNTFNGVREAERTLNIRGISEVLRKKQKTCANYIWLYEEDYCKLSKEQLIEIVNNANDNSTKGGKKTQFKKGYTPWIKGKKGIKTKESKPVFQYSALTGDFIQEFESALVASKEINCNKVGIGHCCRGELRTTGGFIWKYEKLEKVEPIKYVGRTNNKIKDKLK